MKRGTKPLTLKNVMDNVDRMSIYQYIIDNSGIDSKELIRAFELTNNVCYFHLRTLEKFDKIKAIRNIGRTQYYPVQNSMGREYNGTLEGKDLMPIISDRASFDILCSCFGYDKSIIQIIDELPHTPILIRRRIADLCSAGLLIENGREITDTRKRRRLYTTTVSRFTFHVDVRSNKITSEICEAKYEQGFIGKKRDINE